MVLKLYGSALSFARVLVVILEKELPYEPILVDIKKGEHKTDEFKKLQPFGKVPVLDDDGFIVFESRAICKYLARKYPSGTKLMPADDDYKAYALFEQACSVEENYFTAAAATLGKEMMKKMQGGTPDASRIAEAESDLDTAFALYDKTLATQPYLVGIELTLADLFHLPTGTALKKYGFAAYFEKYANVDKWFSGLQQRATWKKAAEWL